jgi:hypothetical protein
VSGLPRLAPVLATAALFLSSGSAAGQVLVSDSFDTHIAGFEAPPNPAGISWSASGVPGGSLQLTTPSGTQPYAWARSQCFERDPTAYYSVEADTFSATGGFCFPAFIAYDGPDCTGNVVSLSTPDASSPSPDPNWTRRTSTGIPPHWPGISLELGLATNGAGICLFDNPVLRASAGPTSTPLEVPGLDSLGLLTLATILAAAAMAKLRGPRRV